MLGLGLLLRVALTFSYTPAHLSYIDTWGYVQEAIGPVFLPHFYRPAGFGRAAVLAQPKAYVRAVAGDLWQYVDPGAGQGARAGFGAPPSTLDIRGRVPQWETFNRQAVDPYYGAPSIRVRGLVETLGKIQAVLRVHGVLILIATLLTLIAFPFAGHHRVALLLCGGTALVCLLGATAVQLYNWRYAVPFTPFLPASGAVAASILAARLRGARAP